MKYFTLIFGCFLALPLMAQEVVGTAIVDGKKIDILKNNTWRYSISSAGADNECREVGYDIIFCGLGKPWTPANIANPDALVSYRWNDRIYSMIIAEDIGSAEGMSFDFMRETVLGYVAAEQGISVSQVPILNVEDIKLLDMSGETIVYSGVMSGLDVTFQNSIFITEENTYQFLTFGIGNTISDELEVASSNFLVNLRTQER